MSADTAAEPHAADGTAPTGAGAGVVLLDAYAARSCPVKTQHRFAPGALPPVVAPRDPDDPLQVRAETGRRHRLVVLERLIEQCEGRVVDLRLLAEDGPEAHAAATRRALAEGVDVVVGPLLPLDLRGHRMGSPDLLVRGDDTATGRPGYHPVLVRWHKIIEPARAVADGEEPASLACTTLSRPRPSDVWWRPGETVRLRTRESDFRQLAHYHRMLQAADLAPERAWGAVVGVEQGPDGPLLCWTDLAAPALRTWAPERVEGWQMASVLERYDDALATRLAIAEAARAGARPQVEPVVVGECGSCPWWAGCRARLDDDDISLRIDRGALDRREVESLRRLGLGTVTALAGCDLDDLLPRYLPGVAHRSNAEGRLRTARRRAAMLTTGARFVRETSGPVELPTAEVEVDFDLESAADGRVYLWGFWVDRPAEPGAARYVAFSRFVDLDEAAETALAVEALGWLRALVEGGGAVAVYHYSGYEVAQISALAARSDDPVLAWAAGYAAEHFVDLLEVVKEHFFGVHGLGLKLIASHAGFRWRDDDPGGLNSQRWFAEAVRSPEEPARLAARRRVLDYNEDDVRATHALRRWLREQPTSDPAPAAATAPRALARIPGPSPSEVLKPQPAP